MLWKGDHSGFEKVCMLEQGMFMAGEKNYLLLVLYCCPLKQNRGKLAMQLQLIKPVFWNITKSKYISSTRNKADKGLYS